MKRKSIPPNWYSESIKIDFWQRLWHKRRFREVVKIIEPVNGEILDVGCNDGTFSKVIFETAKPKKLIGLDIALNSINWARRHGPAKGLEFVFGDAHHLKFKANRFGAIFCLEVLEHVENPLQVINGFKRVMKKGGYGVFLVPSDSFLFRFIWYLWLHFYPRGWVWRETHIQTYRDNFLPKICKKAGFKIEKEKKFNLGMLHLIKVRKI